MRQAALERVTRALRAVIPDYGHRPMTFADFEAAGRALGLRIEQRPGWLSYGTLIRPSLVILRADPPDPWRVFVAFHELGHWLAHRGEPSSREMVDRGDHKRLERLEREADTVGYLALFPGERPARAPRVMGPTLDSVVLRGMTPSGPVRRVVATRKPASVRRIEPQ